MCFHILITVSVSQAYIAVKGLGVNLFKVGAV